MTNDHDSVHLDPGQANPLLPFYFLMFRYRWLVILLMLIGIGIGAAMTKMSYRENYLVKTTILLQPPRKVSDSRDYLGSAQTKELLNNTHSVVLNSNDFIKSIVLADYELTDGGVAKKENLLAYFKTDDVGRAVGILKSQIKIRYDKRTSVLVLEYTSAHPRVAAQILNTTVNQINYFYNYQFNSNSMRNLEFVEKSIVPAKKELDEAKANLSTFIERNKQLKVALKNKDQYPEYYQCIEAMEKLQETAELKRKSYSALLIKSESLKLEISENAPSVTVIEAASPPLYPIPCRYGRSVGIGAIIGLLLAVAYIVLTHFVALFQLDGTPVANIPAEFKKDLRKLFHPFGSRK
jgi:uncharacterized protein involved in exopolysaccharide biosynthesis